MNITTRYVALRQKFVALVSTMTGIFTTRPQDFCNVDVLVAITVVYFPLDPLELPHNPRVAQTLFFLSFTLLPSIGNVAGARVINDFKIVRIIRIIRIAFRDASAQVNDLLIHRIERHSDHKNNKNKKKQKHNTNL